MFQESFKGVSKKLSKFHEYFETVSRKFKAYQKSFKIALFLVSLSSQLPEQKEGLFNFVLNFSLPNPSNYLASFIIKSSVS